MPVNNIENKKTAYIHLGLPKTGSTAIQSTLTQFFNDGILDKYDTKFFHYSTWRYIRNFWYSNDASYCIKKFKEDLNSQGELGKHNIIFSNEILTTCIYVDNHLTFSPAFIPIFKEVFSKYNVKFIIYLRRQDLYWESLVAQLIKGRRADASYFNLYEKAELYYKPLLDAYATHFGKENIIVRAYERDKLYENCVVKDFLHVVELDELLTVDYSTPNDNSSLSDKALRVAAVENEHHLLSPEELQRNLKELENAFKQGLMSEEVYIEECFLLKTNVNMFKNKDVNLDITKRLDLLMGKNAFSHGSSSQGYFTAEERTAFLAKYAEDNAAVAREYLGREDGVLFNDKFPQNIVSITNPSIADVIQVFMPAFVELTKRCDLLDVHIQRINHLEAQNAALGHEIHRLKRPWKLFPALVRKIVNKFK